VINAKIRQSWDALIRPVGRGLSRSHVSPDAITLAGVAIQVVASALIVRGALVAAAFVTLAAAAADLLDGAVAKARGPGRRLGALLDSTTDRLSDGLLFASVAWLYGVDPDIAGHDRPWVAAMALAALVLSFLVSYVKARAEGLGFECDVGIIERAERVGLVIVALLFDILPVVLVVLTFLSAVTFVQRVVHVIKQEPGAP
jgi:CDP-diacylglycerol--glycerol-3-phosphate 3-phosphatidyltransferase